MVLNITLQEYDPGPSNEYVGISYPGVGFFFNNRQQNLVYLVLSSGAGRVVYAICITPAELESMFKEELPNVHVNAASAGIPAKDLKDIIAIMTSKEAGLAYLRRP